jgi:hypothetical protein
MSIRAQNGEYGVFFVVTAAGCETHQYGQSRFQMSDSAGFTDLWQGLDTSQDSWG